MNWDGCGRKRSTLLQDLTAGAEGTHGKPESDILCSGRECETDMRVGTQFRSNVSKLNCVISSPSVSVLCQFRSNVSKLNCVMQSVHLLLESVP
jgi:hypothetical protein